MRIFLDRTRVVRELSAELRLLQRRQVMFVKIVRDSEGDYEVDVKTSDNPFDPGVDGFDVT